MADCTSALTQVDHQMPLISPFYPPIYTPLPPHQGAAAAAAEGKPRRRRRKNKAGGGVTGLRKRKLSEEQANLLEKSFVDEHKLESERKDRLASELGLDPRQVAVWFQNRRARWKSKKLEGEYNRLKTEFDTTLVEKCRLQSQVLELKQQLCEVENKLHMISSERVDVISSNSPSTSSFPVQAGPAFNGEYFRMDGTAMDDVFFLDEYGSYSGGHVEDQWIHQLCGM